MLRNCQYHAKSLCLQYELVCEEGTLDKDSSCLRMKVMPSQVEEAPASLKREP